MSQRYYDETDMCPNCHKAMLEIGSEYPHTNATFVRCPECFVDVTEWTKEDKEYGDDEQ